MEDKVAPAASTLELICDQVENGEFKTMMLVQFLSREDAEIDPVGAIIDKSGSVKIKRGYGETQEPKTSEEARQRMKVLAHAYIMVGLKYPQRAVFQNLEPQDFAHYIDYLMGDQVMNLKSEDEKGSGVSAPTLKLVLSYEHQVRKEMVKKMNAGVRQKQALEEARKDVSIRERYLLTPMSINALSSMQPADTHRSRSPRASGAESSSWTRQKSKGKGKGKSGAKEELHKKTPDGREICYKWNSMKERCRFNCGRVRCCMRCLSTQHPLHMCKEGKAKPDTAGDGGAEKTKWRAATPGVGPPPADQLKPGPTLVRVLYIFAGKRRQTSLRACLEHLSSREFTIEVIEINIIHGEDHDLSREEVRMAWLQRIRDGEFAAILCTPPCSTWTRVRMANMRGPPPIRSRQYPFGYPWLKNQYRSQAELGTILVLFTVEVYEAANEAILKGRVSFIWMFSEHPEDLGRVIREEDRAKLDPAAMWQLQQVQQLLHLEALRLFTVAFNQCCFGAQYKKPTRVISNLPEVKHWGREGWPQFDKDYNYMGPIQPCSCQTSWTLAKRSNQEEFRTTQTSAYPPDMDHSLAQAFFQAFHQSPPSFRWEIGFKNGGAKHRRGQGKPCGGRTQRGQRALWGGRFREWGGMEACSTKVSRSWDKRSHDGLLQGQTQGNPRRRWVMFTGEVAGEESKTSYH